ncbi:DNA repair protein UVH3 isoform X3 [Populus alba]
MNEVEDPAVLAALPPLIQLDLLMRERSFAEKGKSNQDKQLENQNDKHENNAKGKEIFSDHTEFEGSNMGRDHVAAESYNQEKLDEMLAASMVAEEEGSDEDEEMILPHGKVDPAVLAALPPSMQLDLLVQMREKLIAENRQRYQKVKKVPEKFSELQIQAYLKTVAFRREIDQVQKAAAGNDVGGVQASRIASDANREFIFSSSFSGDKELLTTAGVKRRKGHEQQKEPVKQPSSDFVAGVASICKSNTVTGFSQDESSSTFDDDVETYLDERGHMRVSRVRAMGMRMTRDLQRNLDLMKEIEKEKMLSIKTPSTRSVHDRNKIGTPRCFPNENHNGESSHGIDGNSTNLNKMNEQSLLSNETSVQISFEVGDESKHFSSDDEVFASLVAEKPVKISSAGNSTSRRYSDDSAFDSDWEEGIVEGKANSSPNDVELRTKPSLKASNVSDDSEVEWMEGDSDIHDNSSYLAESKRKLVSKGTLEEEAAYQDAIRRSLNDLVVEKFIQSQSNPENIKISGENVRNDSEVEWVEVDVDVHDKSSYPAKSRNQVSGGSIEDEAGLQEAIIRSLSDLGSEKSIHSESDPRNVKSSRGHAYEGVGFLDQEDNSSAMLRKDATQQSKSISEILGFENLGDAGEVNISQAFPSVGSQLKSSKAYNPDDVVMLINESRESYVHSNPARISQDVDKRENECRGMPSIESIGPLEAKENHLNLEPASDIENGGLSASQEKYSRDGSHTAIVASTYLPLTELIDDRNDKKAEPSTFIGGEKISSEAEPPCLSVENSFPEDSVNGSDFAEKLDGEKKAEDHHSERECYISKSASMDNENEQVNFTEASLENEMLILDQEYSNLGDEQRKLERNAESVTSEMFAECQELLQMFGLPYIIAPMEAEAQCAYMELANYVDGAVTDDSDVFLFGARNVYKNIFDDRKYVETYFMKDIEKELGLSREKLIRMALLLGSDYTEGVSGIGIVNAIEVVTAFPEEDGLKKFRDWIESPDPAILGKFDVQTGLGARKKESKVGGSEANCTGNGMEGTNPSGLNIPQAHEEKQSADHDQVIKQVFMDKHRNVSKNWHIPSSFPSEAVISAYSCPQVDKSTEPFTWGKPDLHALHRLCWEKFGWNFQKSDELLLPVLKEYNKHETQLRLEAFYSFNERFAKIRSKRIKKAVKGITGNQYSDMMDDPVEEVSKSRTGNLSGKSGDNEPQTHSKRTARNAPGNKSSFLEKSKPKRSRKRTAEEPVFPEVENTEATVRQCSDRGFLRNRKGRGRGQGRGRGRGRGKANLCFEQSDSSSCDVDSGHDEHEVHVYESSGPHELRKSTRLRKPVNYTVDDLEIDDVEKSLDQGDKKGFDKEALHQDFSSAQEARGDGGIGIKDNEQLEVGDSSLQSFSRDYLERGDGFCFDGEEVGLPGVDRNSHFSEVEPSDDHLERGGGFCLDESDAGMDQGTAHSPPATGDLLEDVEHGTEHLKEVGDGGRTSASETELNADSVVAAAHAGGHLRSSVSGPEITKNETGATGGAGSLSAMPYFLKRKRRKM